jgi:hypothetical protein
MSAVIAVEIGFKVITKSSLTKFFDKRRKEGGAKRTRQDISGGVGSVVVGSGTWGCDPSKGDQKRCRP